MADSKAPEDLDAETRQLLGEQTLNLADDVFRLNDRRLDGIMRELLLRVGKVIAWNLDTSQAESRLQ